MFLMKMHSIPLKHKLRHLLDVGDSHSSRALQATDSDERATRFGGKKQETCMHMSSFVLGSSVVRIELHWESLHMTPAGVQGQADRPAPQRG